MTKIKQTFSDMYKLYISFFSKKKLWKIFLYEELNSYKLLNHLFVPYDHYKKIFNYLRIIYLNCSNGQQMSFYWRKKLSILPVFFHHVTFVGGKKPSLFTNKNKQTNKKQTNKKTFILVFMGVLIWLKRVHLIFWVGMERDSHKEV